MTEKKTALLVMDVQNGIFESHSKSQEDIAPFQKAIEGARENQIPVIYIQVGFREGYPEVSPGNKQFSEVARLGRLKSADQVSWIHEGVRPMPEDLILTKWRVSAFTGSGLEVILRSQGIQQLVLAGIATSGVVLSTVREAADKDYQIQVLSDACLDANSEVHKVLIEQLFPRQSQVLSVAEWVKEIGNN